MKSKHKMTQKEAILSTTFKDSVSQYDAGMLNGSVGIIELNDTTTGANYLDVSFSKNVESLVLEAFAQSVKDMTRKNALIQTKRKIRIYGNSSDVYQKMDTATFDHFMKMNIK